MPDPVPKNKNRWTVSADLSTSSHTGVRDRWGTQAKGGCSEHLQKETDTPEQRPVGREGQANQNGAGAEEQSREGFGDQTALGTTAGPTQTVQRP